MQVRELKVLVVDDSKFVRKKMSATLTGLGVTDITEAENGQEALDRMAEKSFHVIFIDINMPVLDGIGTVRAMREKKLPGRVVICSSLDTEENLEEVKKLGVSSFVFKPFPPEKISEALNEAVEHPTP